MAKSKKGAPIIVIIMFYVLAVIAATLAILFGLEVISEIGSFNPGMFIMGLIIIGFGYILNCINFKSKTQNAKTIAIVEMIVVVVIALIGFIIPSFGVTNLAGFGSATRWVAIILIMHAAIKLILNRHASLKFNHIFFYLYLVFLVLGGYLLTQNIIEAHVSISIVVMLAIAAIFCLYQAITLQTNRKS